MLQLELDLDQPEAKVKEKAISDEEADAEAELDLEMGIGEEAGMHGVGVVGVEEGVELVAVGEDVADRVFANGVGDSQTLRSAAIW